MRDGPNPLANHPVLLRAYYVDCHGLQQVLLPSSPPTLATSPRFFAGFLPDSQWACGGVGEKVSGGNPWAGGNVRGAGAAESREKNSNSQGDIHLTEFDQAVAVREHGKNKSTSRVHASKVCSVRPGQGSKLFPE